MDRGPWDLVIVGGGIVGLATGLALVQRYPTLRVCLLEKEPEVGSHQTGRNSGVVHAGIYYRPGSLKARLCVEGARRLYDFCEAHGVPYQRCGKVIVATSQAELGVLDELFRRGRANGVPGLRRVGPPELRELEPHAAGLAAIHSPNTGIVDFRRVAQVMAGQLETHGAAVVTGARVTAVRRDGPHLRVETAAGEVGARWLVNCAGLYADHVARLSGARPELRLVPFRGEYYRLRAERRYLVRNLIYPVPDPRLPFLGVHFTRMLNGEVEAGPNAVLALAREGYGRTAVRPAELWETVSYPGFLRLARRYWRAGMYEMYRSASKRAFAAALRRLVPEVTAADLLPGGSGVRAQAVAADGTLLDDFQIMAAPGAIHVLNAPSPAATASLAIGDHLADLAARTFELPR